MKKLLIGISLLASFAAMPAFAQQISCASVPAGLSTGSHGSAVTGLQRFLVAQNYSGSGSWMITGNYGPATTAAVRIYQGSHGLPQTGSVDARTAAAIGAGCGSGAGSNYSSQQPN